MGLSKANEEPDNADVECEPQGEYVRPERVAQIDDLLGDGEPVHYLLSGPSLDVKDADSADDHPLTTDGAVRVAVTDRRVVLKIPRMDGRDDRSIPYADLTGVGFDTGLVKCRVSFETERRTDRVEVATPEKPECREAVEFVRDRMAE